MAQLEAKIGTINDAPSDVFVTGKYQVSDPIHAKAGDAQVDLYVLAPLTKGTYPVLLFCHGYKLPNTGYQTLLNHIASHGYIVVAPKFYGLFSTMSPAEEISRAAQVAEWLSTGLPAVLPPGVNRDMDNLALSGHSRGGKTAFALAMGRVERKKTHKKKTSSNNTPPAQPYKFKALIGVDPVAGLAIPIRQQPRILEYIPRCFDMCTPVAVIGTGLGNQSVTRLFPPMVVPPFAPNGVSHAEFFGESRPPACYFLAKEYGHVDMMDDWVIKWLSWVCKSREGSKEDMRRSVGGIVVAFLRYYLGGDVKDLNAIVGNRAVAPVTLDPVFHVKKE